MLDYLFTARYNDGTFLLQTQEDVSSTRPGAGSAFTDVDHDKLVEFELFHCKTGKRYIVDLRDGTFATESPTGQLATFRLHEYPVSNLRLIFFRRHTHSYAATVDATGHETNHTTVYRLGWQGNDHEGKNVQHVLEFD